LDDEDDINNLLPEDLRWKFNSISMTTNGLKQTSCVSTHCIATRNRSTLNSILNHD
jgi:hypothetical protein